MKRASDRSANLQWGRNLRFGLTQLRFKCKSQLTIESFNRQGIEASKHIFLHLACRVCALGESVVVLRKPPMLSNKVQLGVELRVKTTNVSSSSDEFFQL